MLANDPPPGTRVRFVREVRTAKANDIGVLQRPMGRYLVERATDAFEVNFRGERMIVQRQDIEQAPPE
jgi:hypothetical protein